MTANSSDAGLILEYEITKNLIKNYLLNYIYIKLY